jgi:hypothetical protein
MQPVVTDDQGVVRFQGNAIIQHMFEKGQFVLDDLGAPGFSVEDHEQLLQLLGFSVSGYGDMAVRKRSILKADAMAATGETEESLYMGHLKSAHRSLIAAFRTAPVVERTSTDVTKPKFLSSAIKQRIGKAEQMAIKTTC